MRRAAFIISIVSIGAVLTACSRPAPSDGLTYVGSADTARLEAFREDFIAIADTNGWAVTDSSSLPGGGILHVFGMKDCLIAISDGSAEAQLLSFDFHDKCAEGERTDAMPEEFRPLIEEYGLEGSREEPPLPHLE